MTEKTGNEAGKTRRVLKRIYLGLLIFMVIFALANVQRRISRDRKVMRRYDRRNQEITNLTTQEGEEEEDLEKKEKFKFSLNKPWREHLEKLWRREKNPEAVQTLEEWVSEQVGMRHYYHGPGHRGGISLWCSENQGEVWLMDDKDSQREGGTADWIFGFRAFPHFFVEEEVDREN